MPPPPPLVAEVKTLSEAYLDDAFEATVEAVEEAVISSMYHAKTTTGRNGLTVHSLKEFL
jgi:D-aminopeptidase